MECRKWIVAKHMRNPEKWLLISDCQGLAVDMTFDDISRVFRFLDLWGIINYCASDVLNCEQWNGELYLKEDANGEVHVLSDSLKSIDKLIKFEKPRSSLKPPDVTSSTSSNNEDLSDLNSITGLQAALAGSPDIVVSTPACIPQCLNADVLQAKAIHEFLEILILDEADLLLSNGYENDLIALTAHVPSCCQCLLMSATTSDDVEKLNNVFYTILIF